MPQAAYNPPFQVAYHLKCLKALSNKDVLFIFSANKVAAEEVRCGYLWNRKL